jgi:hypothetical protein
MNDKCPVQPFVFDGIGIADDRGSDAYIEAAIIRWNRRNNNENTRPVRPVGRW